MLTYGSPVGGLKSRPRYPQLGVKGSWLDLNRPPGLSPLLGCTNVLCWLGTLAQRNDFFSLFASTIPKTKHAKNCNSLQNVTRRALGSPLVLILVAATIYCQLFG